MPGPITSSDLLSQVRSQVDEANSESISDADIYAALNRAQRKACNVLVKHFPDLFLTYTTQALTAGTDTYDIPTGAYGRRISQILVLFNTLEYVLKRVMFSDLHKYTSASQTKLPGVYALKGRSYVVKPMPSSSVSLKIWYPAAPETIVAPQGRITSVNVASTYVLLDALGSGLTTSVAALGAYVNVIDASTGAIKATLQTASLTTASSQVTFKTSGLSAATVYGRTVATAIPTTVAVNDYVCAVQGTCVPDLPDACLDFLIQYGVAEIRRRLGEPMQDENAMLAALESDVQTQWVNREIVSKITNRSRAWTR